MESIKPFGELFSLSWSRLWAKKKQLIVPAIFGGGLRSCTFGGGGDSSGGAEEGMPTDLPLEGESLSLVPKAYAQDVASANPDVAVWIIIAILVAFVAVLIIIYIAHLYSLLVIYDQHKNFKSSLHRSLQSFFPYIGISIWKVIRSYVWIPMLVMMGSGFWFALQVAAKEAFSIPLILLVVAAALCTFGLSLYYMPRLKFADVVYFTEKTGVKASVEKSLKQTNMYWWKIVCNGLLFSLCMLGVFLSLVLGVLLTIVPFGLLLVFAKLNEAVSLIAIFAALFAAGIAMYFLVQYIAFWSNCFYFELYRTIAKNPRSSNTSG